MPFFLGGGDTKRERLAEDLPNHITHTLEWAYTKEQCTRTVTEVPGCQSTWSSFNRCSLQINAPWATLILTD